MSNNSLKDFTIADLPSLEVYDDDLIYDLWNMIEPLIVKHRKAWEFLYTLDWIKEGVLSGMFVVWHRRDPETQKITLVILTRIVAYPRRKVVEAFLAVGEGLLESFDIVGVGEHCASHFGIDASLIQGRLGFKKVLEKEGYSILNTTYVKQLPIYSEVYH